MASAPTSIIIPASPLDAQLLSASSAFTFVPHPNPSPISSTASSNLSGAPNQASPSRDNPSGLPQEPQHFITKRQFEKWQVSQPKESRQLRPPAASEGVDKMTLQGYRAPQHPASHLLQSIPPRAPSRSSRSNILSYTLHLATSSRLSSYSSEHGTRTLLHWAETDGFSQDYEPVKIDAEWFETEQKTQGLWKLGLNLLQSSRREGSLPPSVERRVVLAGLAEELLVSPSGERAITKIDEDTVHPSVEVEELVALKPLTSPDTTTLYLSTSAHATDSRSPRDRSHSVAQSLIDLKFGGKPSEPTSAPLPIDSVSNSGQSAAASSSSAPIPGSSVFGEPPSALDASTSTSTSELTATPHMDYRIVQSQSMRSRAKSIFATSPLPSLTTSFCRRHRVSACSVCTTLITETEERSSDHARDRRRNVPGAGLRTTSGIGRGGSQGEGAKKALVALVPTFLKLSADFIGDTKLRFKKSTDSKNGQRNEDEVGEEDENVATSIGGSGRGKGKQVEENYQIHATSAWYDLLTSLLTQACLEGYLVDGWTGTEGIETLFGVGCGVWEGRGWSTATRIGAFPSSKRRPEVPIVVVKNTENVNVDGEDSEYSSEEEEEEGEEEIKQRNREREAMELVEAAHSLFGSRDVAQAEYERGMRDRIHEFLNVPRDKNLIQHLNQLNAKYPLSVFEDDMVDFLESSVRSLGKPALAKLDPRTANSTTSASSLRSGPPAAADPDQFALAQYFAATTNTSPATPTNESTFPRPEGKRRRLD